MMFFQINKVVFNWADTEDGPRIIDETEDQSGKVTFDFYLQM